VRWGTDWLVNAHPLQTNELFVQVGKENVDHNYWGSDLNIPNPRPAFKVGGKRHGTDVAGATVATFASASILFKDKYEDVEYSNLLLTHAKKLYEFAELKQFELYSKNVPEVLNLYATLHLEDKLVWGALWLYKATGDVLYLNKARDYFKQFAIKGYTNVINWADNTCATFILFAQLTNGTKSPNELSWKLESERYLDVMIDPPKSPRSKCSYTAGGLLFCNGDSDSNSLNVPLNIGFVALMYAPYATTPAKAEKYKKFAISQISYTLGKNPRKSPYIVGVSPKSPQNPHHAGAHGSKTNDLKNPIKTTNVIYGAIVGGPDRNDAFVDDRNNFKFTEVALDYNAPWQGLMAFQVVNMKDNKPAEPNDPNDTNGANNTSEPNTNDTNGTNNPVDNKNAEDKAPRKINSGTVVAAIGIIVGLILSIVIAIVTWKWVKKRKNDTKNFTRLP